MASPHPRSYYAATSVGDPLGSQLGAVPKNLFAAGLTWQATPEWRNPIMDFYNGAHNVDSVSGRLDRA